MKVVVWAHNSHLGDARATQMGEQGEFNVGQLVRERFGRDCRLIGFTGYTGTVTAASSWGGPAERKLVRPGLLGSYEDLFHKVDLPSFTLSLNSPHWDILACNARAELSTCRKPSARATISFQGCRINSTRSSTFKTLWP